MKTIERIFDVSTGKTTDIERDMTDEELEQYNKAMTEMQNEELVRAQVEEKKQNALKKLSELGLTLDDLKALGLG